MMMMGSLNMRLIPILNLTLTWILIRWFHQVKGNYLSLPGTHYNFIYLYLLISIFLLSKLYWISESTTSTSGWSIDYKNVLLHAISKPDDSSPRPYIYLQLSCNKIIDSDGQEIRFDGNNSDSYDSEKFVEVNLFVEGVEVADEMFVALSECASLHPCDTDSDTEKDKDDTEIEIDAKRSKIDMERFEDAAEN